jgi:uncharacterized protein YggU (UPF0235/DUF167 family)
VILSVRAHPRASRDRVAWDGERLHAWVTAPAVDDRANRAIVLAVARWLGVSPASVRVVAGTRGRTKLVEVDGEPRLPPPAPAGDYQTR